MNKIIFCLILLSNTAYANFAEMFGSSATTSAIGNQANGDPADAGNIFYVPSLAAFHDKTTLSITGASVTTDFNPITNIITDNARTSSDVAVPITGNVSTEYDPVNNTAININLPLANDNGNIALSIFTPIGSLMEFNSGDPFLPEYVMHRARYKRTLVYGNYAKKFRESWAWSVGFLFGIQSGGDAQNQSALNGSTYGSSASMKVKAKPSLAGAFSITKKFEKSLAYFSYQQEMKSNTSVRASGIETNLSIPYDTTFETMTYFDPHIFRFGYVFKSFSIVHLFGTLEYQIWDNYKTPVIRIKRNSGSAIIASDNAENLNIRNILIPKIGASYFINEKLTASLGVHYRPSPIDSDFSGAGNSLDSDTFTISTGAAYDLALWGLDIELAGSLQYHKMKDITVTKTANMENGAAGDKVGSGGYTVGGEIIAASVGASLQF